MDSYLFWDTNEDILRLFCSGETYRNEQVYCEHPELWSLQVNGWTRDAVLRDLPLKRKLAAYDPVTRSLLLFFPENGDTWLWDGTRWDRKAGNAFSQHQHDYYIIFNSTSARIELLCFSLEKKWYYDGNEWLEDLSYHVPRDLWIYSNIVYDHLSERIYGIGTVANIVSPYSGGRFLWAITKENAKALAPFSSDSMYGGSPYYIVRDDGRDAVLIISEKNDKFLITEVSDDQLNIVESENAPLARYDGCFAYHHNLKSIIMYGGSGNKNESFFSELLKGDKWFETWSIEYVEEKNCYVWSAMN